MHLGRVCPKYNLGPRVYDSWTAIGVDMIASTVHMYLNYKSLEYNMVIFPDFIWDRGSTFSWCVSKDPIPCFWLAILVGHVALELMVCNDF